MMIRYYIEDTPLKPAHLQRVMRFRDGEFPEEYDAKSKRWVVNKDLWKIYDGSLECDPITAEEAEAIINARNSKADL